MSTKSKEELYNESMDTLKDNGVRITPQRQIILNYLINHDNHPSVETIFQVLNKTFPNLSMATVYNNLRLFKKLKIVIEMPSSEGGYRYDFYGQPHFHAVCDTCGKIMDVEDPEFERIDKELQEVTKKIGFQPALSNVEVHGECKECAAKEEAKKA